MVRGKKTSASTPEAAAPQEPLAAEVESLRNEVRVLRQAIDEVREELQYLNNNGVRLRDVDQLPPIGILKRMAADVTSSDCSQRLQIDHGTAAGADQCEGRTKKRGGTSTESTVIVTPASPHAQPVASSRSEAITPEPKLRKPRRLFQ